MKTRKPKSVWVIEEGYDSDYRVVGVFSSRKNADYINKIVNGTVGEWPVDPLLKELRKGWNPYHVLMLRDGAPESVHRLSLFSYNMCASSYICRRSQSSAYAGEKVQDCLRAQVWARDEKHAVKITDKIRRRMIAQGEWE